MLVREVMTSSVVTVQPQATIRSASMLMADHRITALPVVDESGLLVGVVSEADVVRDALIPDQRAHLLRVPIRDGPNARYVGEVMTPMPLTICPRADLAEAVQMMTDTGLKSLPVTEDGRVVGVVSRTDVVAQLAHRDERVQEEVEALLRAERVSWTVGVLDGVVAVTGVRTDRERRLAELLVGSVRGVVGIRFGGDEPA